MSAAQLADKVEEAVLERLKPLLIKAQVTGSSHLLAFHSSEMKSYYIGHTDPLLEGQASLWCWQPVIQSRISLVGSFTTSRPPHSIHYPHVLCVGVCGVGSERIGKGREASTTFKKGGILFNLGKKFRVNFPFFPNQSIDKDGIHLIFPWILVSVTLVT